MIVTPHTRLLLAIATAALAAGGLSACSSKSPAKASSTISAAPQSATGTTLHFVATDEDGNMVTEDLGAKSPEGGPDLGDLLVFTQALSVDGKPAGEVHVAAVGVDHTRHLAQINGTLVLADGDIEVGGIVPQDPTFTLAVTGGTGKYVGAAGTMDFNLDGETQTLTAHLQR